MLGSGSEEKVRIQIWKNDTIPYLKSESRIRHTLIVLIFLPFSALNESFEANGVNF